MMDTYQRLESEVRSYCRAFPVELDRACGSELFDGAGKRYLDFFAGAGALNYGHNPPHMKEALLRYLTGDRVVHSLDMYTRAKRALLERFEEVILKPRGLDYKVQFPGPTGTNAVEAALKLARKVTGRPTIASFTNAFHGMTLGALAATGNNGKRAGAGVPLANTITLPYCGYPNADNTIEYIDQLLCDPSSGVELPAAVIVETVQAEGGINTASFQWLRAIRELTRRHDILLIVDDIQVGCGRTGPFFSFEMADIKPDMVCLSKSLSGYGLPLAVVLLSPEVDVWDPGEHNGTFRGHNPAFVTATAALDLWENDELERSVARKAELVRTRLEDIAQKYPGLVDEVRGRGLIFGLACTGDCASRISRAAFDRGLIIETAGAKSQVVKILPPLTTTDDQLDEGLDILSASVAAVA
ncbi:MAG TPA: diaminobutyrate--2-oxoglutarate transaminase [Kofleriaceae bacterium]|nr:diaminobutyrate--2-oxoglutarate transaminase [Kofleriaceae bacterium]